MSCEDEELEADLVAIACEDSVTQLSSHSEVSAQPIANESSSGATASPAEPTASVIFIEQEARGSDPACTVQCYERKP